MKSHFIISSEPRKEGQTQTALCGEVLENVVYISDDLDLRFHEVTRLINCRKCLQANVVKAKYFYAAIRGQNSTFEDGTK